MGNLTFKEVEKEITAQRDPVPYYLFYDVIGLPAPDKETAEIGCALVKAKPLAYGQEQKRIEQLILIAQGPGGKSSLRPEIPPRTDFEENGLVKKELTDSSDYSGNPDRQNVLIKDKTRRIDSFKQKIEQRLSSLDDVVISRTLEVLKNYEADKVIPKSERRNLIYEFQEQVSGYFNKIPGCTQDFGVLSNNRLFPKALLEIVAKGIENVEDKLPPEFLSCLANIGGGYPLVYFIAGLSKKSGDFDESLIASLNLNTAVLTYIACGSGLLLGQHSFGEIKSDYKQESQLPDLHI